MDVNSAGTNINKIPPDVFAAFKNIQQATIKYKKSEAEYLKRCVEFDNVCNKFGLMADEVMTTLTKACALVKESACASPDAMIRSRILNFIDDKKDGVESGDLLEFFNVLQEDASINKLPDVDWLRKNSRLIKCTEINKKRKYTLTDMGKKARKYLNSTGSIDFHPDYISNNRGWADGPGNATSQNPQTVGGSVAP